MEQVILAGHETRHLTQDATVTIKQHADATLIDSGANVTIILEPNARLRYITQSSKSKRTIHLQEHAHLVWTDIAFNSESDNTVYLNGDGADARFGSIFLGKDSDRCGQNVTMVHNGSHTSSYMLTRAVMLNNSQGSYRGLIRVMPQAKGCTAHQREDALLIGDKSRMDAVPILEISNEDVQCSHGVTLGQVDETQLFYLESRGIARNEAIAMIVQGFFDQMLIAMGEAGERFRNELSQVTYG